MSRKDQILELVKSGPVDVRQVSEKLGISGANAGMVLKRMHQQRLLAREGAPKGYRYYENVSTQSEQEPVAETA